MRYRCRLCESFIVSLFLIVIFSRNTYQESDITRIKRFSESQFISHGLPLANSPPLVRNLAENEELIYIIIKDFYKRYGLQDNFLLPPRREPFRLIHSYLERFEKTTGQQLLKLERQRKNINNYRPFKTAWNPLTSFLMFQRFLKPLKEIVRSLNPTMDSEFALQKQILNVMKSTGWPQQQDLSVATSAILRIQHVYDLGSSEVSRGNLAGLDTNIILSPEDCVEIGKQAVRERYFALAVEWFEAAQNSNATNADTDSNVEITITDYIKHSHEIHDHHWNLSAKSVPYFFTSPIKNGISRIRRRTMMGLQNWEGNHIGLNMTSIRHASYWGTCSGENYKNEMEKSKLFCWHETEVNLFFKINPLKVELLSIQPLVILRYYDLIGDEMMKKLKREATDKLKRSVLVGGNSDPIMLSARTSLNSWIDDISTEKFSSISKMIEAVSGLIVRNPYASELLQVVAYSTGSHYLTHLDALDSTMEGLMIEQLGNRIATFIFYVRNHFINQFSCLSDVEKGGGTSFPQSGIAVEPIKGSAVLWYNLLLNGDPDNNTWHGACPVIIGEKWISNKWIRSHEQMFIKEYKCSLNQSARLRLRINGKHLMETL